MDFLSLVQKTQIFFEQYGYITIFISSFIEITPLGWAVPGGVILALAGFFANTDKQLNLVYIILSGTLGGWLTLILSYLLGRRTGMWLVIKLHQEKTAAFARGMLKKHGGAILTTSMMANLTRFWVAYAAGMEKYGVLRFVAYSFIASLGWTSIMTFLGYLAGYERGNIERLARSIGAAAWVFLLLAVIILARSIKHEYQHFKKDLPESEHGHR